MKMLFHACNRDVGSFFLQIFRFWLLARQYPSTLSCLHKWTKGIMADVHIWLSTWPLDTAIILQSQVSRVDCFLYAAYIQSGRSANRRIQTGVILVFMSMVGASILGKKLSSPRTKPGLQWCTLPDLRPTLRNSILRPSCLHHSWCSLTLAHVSIWSAWCGWKM